METLLEWTEPYQLTLRDNRAFRKAFLRLPTTRGAAADRPRQATDERVVPKPEKPGNADRVRTWPVGWVLLILMSVLLLVGLQVWDSKHAAPASSASPVPPVSSWIPAMAGAGAVFGVLLIILGAWLFLRLPDIPDGDEARWRWDGRGIHKRLPGSRHLAGWHAIDRWRETDRLIVYRIRAGQPSMIPKAALHDGQQAELCALLTRHAGTAHEGDWYAD